MLGFQSLSNEENQGKRRDERAAEAEDLPGRDVSRDRDRAGRDRTGQGRECLARVCASNRTGGPQ